MMYAVDRFGKDLGLGKPIMDDLHEVNGGRCENLPDSLCQYVHMFEGVHEVENTIIGRTARFYVHGIRNQKVASLHSALSVIEKGIFAIQSIEICLISEG
jgi:hypothetical protein